MSRARRCTPRPNIAGAWRTQPMTGPPTRCSATWRPAWRRLRRASRASVRANPRRGSQELQLDCDLVARRKIRLAPNLCLHRQEIAAAVEREDRCPPRHVIDARLDFHRPEPARVAESMRSDLVRLFLGYRDEVPAPRGFRALPDPQQRGDRDHGFFCQSY